MVAANSKLYDVIISLGAEKIKTKIGFKTIQVAGKKLLLNGKPLFMRGIPFTKKLRKV